MTINVFLPFLLFFSLSLNWEREYIIGYREKQSLCLLIFSMGSFREYFLFYWLTEFIYAYHSGLKALSSSSCPRFFLLSLPGVWCEIRPHLFRTTSVPKLFFTQSLAWDPFTTTSVPKLIFFFPITADRKKVPLSF